jgi:hypothetical protein
MFVLNRKFIALSSHWNGHYFRIYFMEKIDSAPSILYFIFFILVEIDD